MSALFGLLKLVPAWLWGAIAVGVAVVVGVHWIEDLGYQRGSREKTAELQPQIDKLKNDIAAERARYRSEIADWVVQGTKDKEALQSKVNEQQAQIAKDNEDAKARIRAYVSQAANAACPIPAGAVLFVNEGAARANGATARPAEPARSVADAPSGVSLDTVLGLVRDTQSALGQCRSQVLGWQDFWETVRARWAALQKALQPKSGG